MSCIWFRREPDLDTGRRRLVLSVSRLAHCWLGQTTLTSLLSWRPNMVSQTRQAEQPRIRCQGSNPMSVMACSASWRLGVSWCGRPEKEESNVGSGR